jgi:hypothetical protein
MHSYPHQTFWRSLLISCLCLGLFAACGGGGGGSVSNVSDVAWPVQTVSGRGHVTVYWESQSGAQTYEVWTQPASASGAASAVMSRSFDATITPLQNLTARQWSHTVTELDTALRHRIWVRARMTSGLIADSSIVEQSVAAFPRIGEGNNANLIPSTVSSSLLVVDTLGGVAVDNREDYRTATYSLYANSAARLAGVSLHTGAVELRGRGNSSWINHAKKSYRLRLQNSTALLSMPANRHWVLLANHADKSLLRNTFAYEASRRMGFAWTPRNRSVELILNGQYLGAYELVEHVRIGSQRVNIAVTDGDTAPNVTGGYLIEIDRNDGAQSFISTLCNLSVHVNAPDPPTTAQVSYLQNAFNAAEAALHSTTFADPTLGYAAHLDVDSFVDWYLHSELMHHVDAFRFSTYMSKARNGNFKMGPVWDFDLAMGNFSNYFAQRPGRADTDGAATGRCWYRRLLADPAFEQRVRTRWQSLRQTSLADGMQPWLLAQAQSLMSAQVNNYQRWQVIDKPTWSNVVVTGSYGAEIEYVQWWLQRRLAWMDSRWMP